MVVEVRIICTNLKSDLISFDHTIDVDEMEGA